MRSFVFSSHILTYIHTYTPTEPSLPVVLSGTSFHWHRWWWEKETYKDRQRGNCSSRFHEFTSDLLFLYSNHKSHVPAPYIYPSAIHPYFPFTASIYHSQLSSIHQCSKRNHSTVLELPSRAIHPFTPPIYQSVPQTISYLVSWPFTHLLTSEMWPFSHPSFFIHLSIHPLLCV